MASPHDRHRTTVTGCSRNGKGAFAIGVLDDRIALTIPHETSTAGVPAYRIADVLGRERTDHNDYGLNWLSNDFDPFVFKNNVSNAVKLPIDTHALIAMIAPRGLLVRNIAKFLKHEGEAPGELVVGSGGSLSMSDWVDWEAPTLK
ncbi:glucuronyl esterase domain-containing protein [Sorangium sp. So ce362]|uniref:glucuronyl esterase domain-containing protein n=1 Tax=Sorangium sp. So ce362 TaxID=3133303 RepID=UPI003F61AF76